MVRNWYTDVVTVEDPVVGALQAGLLVPVPGGTADIRNRLNWSEDTLSVVEVVANIARKTVAIGVKCVALI